LPHEAAWKAYVEEIVRFVGEQGDTQSPSVATSADGDR